jgi:hypothetical protein
MSRHFESDAHALKTGMFAGFMMKHGLHVKFDIDEDGDYTSHVTVWDDDERHFLVKVLP